jgi:hypothetical protein
VLQTGLDDVGVVQKITNVSGALSMNMRSLSIDSKDEFSGDIKVFVHDRHELMSSAKTDELDGVKNVELETGED